MTEYNGLLTLEPRELTFKNVRLKQVGWMFRRNDAMRHQRVLAPHRMLIRNCCDVFIAQSLKKSLSTRRHTHNKSQLRTTLVRPLMLAFAAEAARDTQSLLHPSH